VKAPVNERLRVIVSVRRIKSSARLPPKEHSSGREGPIHKAGIGTTECVPFKNSATGYVSRCLEQKKSPARCRAFVDDANGLSFRGRLFLLARLVFFTVHVGVGLGDQVL
jgi:hypothetical protein